MAGEDENPFDFAAAESIAPIRQVAENAIAHQARRGSIVLFFVGGLQLVFIFLFGMRLLAEIVEWHRFGAPDGVLDIHPLVYFSFALGLLLGILFLGLGFWTRRDPVLAPALGLGLYVGANLFDGILFFGFGLTILPSGCWFWLLRVLIVVLLIDGIRAGLAYRKIVNRLIVEIGEKK